MKARIEVVYREFVEQPEQIKKGWLGGKTVIPAVMGGRHCVGLYLEASEEEKAVIKLNELDQFVIWEWKIDNKPNYEQDLAEAKNDLHRKIITEVYEKNGRYTIVPTTLADVLSQSPWERTFTSKLEANEFASELKNEVLPKIKKVLAENSQVGPTSETFEL